MKSKYDENLELHFEDIFGMIGKDKVNEVLDDIDYSDIPELGDEFLTKEKINLKDLK